MADLDLFLKIDGIEGEVQDPKHKGQLRIENYSNALKVDEIVDTAGGTHAGQLQWPDAEFTMRMDKAYPKLFQYCVDGARINQAVLTFRKAGREQQEFLKVTFSDVLISRCKTGGVRESNSVPIVTFAFNYVRIEEEYKAQKADGSLSGGITFKGRVA